MADGLTIWLYGEPVAHIRKTRNGRLRLKYTEQALETYELGELVLSYNLPVSLTDFPNRVTSAFTQGLLPEGDALRAIAQELNLLTSDTYGLISALGRDCAGALVIQPDDELAPRVPTVNSAESLTETELAHLVDNLRSAPLGVDQRVRISLGGAQEKLVLTLRTDGTWGRPVDGTPSTHILKPQIRGLDHTVENEAFCMRAARHLGLSTAEVNIITVLNRPLLVVRRYDRRIHADGTVERIHQEDFCQALGLIPGEKYEEDGGPSLRQIAQIIQAVAPTDDLDDFLRAVTLNAILGNGDAHGKNFSLLHERSGQLRLAPLYDVLSTLVYGQNRLAMYIDGVQRTERVTAERIVNEAVGWGMPRRRASELVFSLLDAAPDALRIASKETPALPRSFLERIHQQLRHVRDG